MSTTGATLTATSDRGLSEEQRAFVEAIRDFAAREKVDRPEHDGHSHEVAAALLAGIQGGVGVMLATGDLSYLEAALDVGIESLRPAE